MIDSRRALSLVIAAALAVSINQVSFAAAENPSLFGFATTGVAAEITLEHDFDSKLNAPEIGAWLKQMSSGANHVGAPHNKANAEFMLKLFREWGWQVEIETFDVLYPTPKHMALELVAPNKFRAKLHEPQIAGDATSKRSDNLPPYNVYGADGDVTADLVYVNRGIDDDYRELARHGVDVKGKIVITRYGGGWRGLKPKLAYEHGAIGCLIYSDPQDDGYAQGDTYPKGGWRPADAVQRGSVAVLPTYSGDPLTPGVGANATAQRLALDKAETLLKIPVMPISYADAQVLLQALTGQVAPESWRGALPITYHIGPGPARVHMSIQSDWSRKPVYDVVAKIPGSMSPDEWVVRGNHHDAWVFGAWDPLSGVVAMMAEAKAIGALLKTGWKPKRTIVFASWDGEEPGLLGSTEWAETHAAELERKIVLYLNSDENTRGFLDLAGSHSMQAFVNEVADAVKDPETGVTVRERLRALTMVNGYGPGASERTTKDAKQAAAGGDLPIGALGTGSDYTPFLQHLGVATLSVSYSGEDDQGGVYHSMYDSYDHFARFGDPGFKYAVTQAETAGRMVLRIANADVLPLQFSGFADTIDDYLQELHKLADSKRESSEALAKLIDQKAFSLAADPTRPVLAPERELAVPFFNFAPLDNVVPRLKLSAKAYDDAYARFAKGEVQLTAANRNTLNALLQGMEHTLTSERGLPGRPWYRHLIYAPGTATGYGAKTLPGVREAIEQKRWNEADEYVALTALALAAYCDRLDQATALLGTPPR
jgi:N-acetylated-alpha-linked acidic dipeptidase